MAGWRFWEWESEEESNARAAQDVIDAGTKLINQAQADKVYDLGMGMLDDFWQGAANIGRAGLQAAARAPITGTPNAPTVGQVGQTLLNVGSVALTPEGQTPVRNDPAAQIAALPGQVGALGEAVRGSMAAPMGVPGLGQAPFVGPVAQTLDVAQKYPHLLDADNELGVQAARAAGIPGHETMGFKAGPFEVGPAELVGAAVGIALPNPSLPGATKAVGAVDDLVQPVGAFAQRAAREFGSAVDDLAPEALVRVRRPKPDELTQIARHVLNQTKANGGETFNFSRALSEGGSIADASLGGKVDAYAVSMFPDRSEIIEGKAPTMGQIRDFIKKNWDLLQDSRNSLGTWASEGKVYLDVSSTPTSREVAEQAGRKFDQEAIFGLKDFEEIPTGGSGKHIPADTLPPAAERLESLVGPEIDVARAAKGNVDWWDREYGLSDAADEMRRVQGLERALHESAASSPDGLPHLSGEQLRPYMQPSSESMLEGANALNAGQAVGVPTSVDELRNITKLGLQHGWGEWYQQWGQDIAHMLPGIDPQEGSFLFARYSSQLSPEQAKIASMATAIAARETNGFAGMDGAAVQKAVYDIMDQVGARKPAISAEDGAGIASLYASGSRTMGDKSWKTATFQGNLGQGRRPWTYDPNFTGDVQAQRVFGYRAWHAPKDLVKQADELKRTMGKAAPVAIDYQGRLMTDHGAWQYMGTMGRAMAREFGAEPSEVQAAQWVVGQRAVVPTGAGILKAFKELNPTAPVFTDPAKLRRWTEIAKAIQAGDTNVGRELDELVRLGIYELKDPAALENVNATKSITGLAQAWAERGMSGAGYPGQKTGPGLIYESSPDRPWMKGSVKAIAENPLAARAQEEAPVVYSSNFVLPSGRHLTDLAIPNSLVDVGHDARTAVKLPTLSPQLGRSVAQDLADSSSSPTIVFRDVAPGERPNGIQWTVDRRFVPSLTPESAGRVRDALGDDGDLIVTWDGRNLQVYLHPEAADPEGAAGRVYSALQGAGIGRPKSKGYVHEQVRPRGADAAAGREVPAGAARGAAGAGSDAGVLRDALERVLGRNVGRRGVGPVDADGRTLLRAADQLDASNPHLKAGARPYDDALSASHPFYSPAYDRPIPGPHEWKRLDQIEGQRPLRPQDRPGPAHMPLSMPEDAAGAPRTALEKLEAAKAADAANPHLRAQARPYEDAIVTREQALRSGVGVDIPEGRGFRQAVENTADAEVTSDGLRVRITRGQKPVQAGEVSDRTANYYLAAGTHKVNRGVYSGALGDYGGQQAVEGETLIRRPYAIQSVPGDAAGVAYHKLHGREAVDTLSEAIGAITDPFARLPKERVVEGVRAILKEYNAGPEAAEAIVAHQRGHNAIYNAVFERIVAFDLRERGYDALVGYHGAGKNAKLTEIMDVRELTAPTADGSVKLHPRFEPGKVSEKLAAAEAADAANPHLKGAPYDDAMSARRDALRPRPYAREVSAEDLLPNNGSAREITPTDPPYPIRGSATQLDAEDTLPGGGSARNVTPRNPVDAPPSAPAFSIHRYAGTDPAALGPQRAPAPLDVTGAAEKKLADSIQWEETPTARPGRKQAVVALIRNLFDNTVDVREIADQYARTVGHPLSIDEDAWKLLRLSRGSEAAAELFREEYLAPAVKGLDEAGLRDLNLILKANDAIDKQKALDVALDQKIIERIARRKGAPVDPALLKLKDEEKFIQRARDLGRHNFGGLGADEAETALAEIQARVGPERWGELMERAQQVWTTGHRVLQYKVRQGLVNATQAADLIRDYPHYSPIRIVEWLEDQVDNAGKGAGSGLSVRSNGLAALTAGGTEKQALAPLDAYVSLVSSAYRLGTRNEAAQAMVRYFRDDPELASLVRPANKEAAAYLGSLRGDRLGKRAPGETTFAMYAHGERLEFYVDKSLKQAFESNGPELFADWPVIREPLKLSADLLRQGATGANVLFMLPNAVGDAMTYFVRGGGLRHLPEDAYYLAKGYKSSFLKDDAYKAMIGAGGGMSGWFGREVFRGTKTIKGYAGPVSTADQLFGLLKDLATFRPVKELGQRVEEATRMAEFHRLSAQGADARTAALGARDVTIDFARGGLFPKALNSLIPFFNVGFQAPAQTVRMFQNPDTRALALWGLATMVILPTVAAEAWNRTHGERYDDVPQYLKDRGLILMLPNQGDEVDPETGRPIPRYAFINLREWSPFAVAVREGMRRMLGDDARTWDDLALALARNTSPIEPGQGVGGAIADVMPPAIKTGVELATNHDFFRDRQIVPDSLKHLPPEEQYTSATSETAKQAGRLLGASPLKVEHAVRGVGAGVAGQALAAGDLALKAAGVAEVPQQRLAKIEQELARTGLNPEQQEKLERERDRLLSAKQNRDSLVREKPIVGGLATSLGYREQGGQLETNASKANTEALKAAGKTPVGAELKRLGMELPDVQPRIEGVYLDRRRAEAYRANALDYRQRLLDALVEQPYYQNATDAEKSRLIRAANTRAADWAGQSVLPGEFERGKEFASPGIGGDIDRAVEVYVRAVGADQDLRGMRSRRFIGVSPEEADALVTDQSTLTRFRSALGKTQGDMMFIRQFGAARFARLQRLTVSPLYDLQVRRIKSMTPEYNQIFAPDVPMA